MWAQTDISGQPIKGQGVRLNVIEYGWDPDHEDYKLTTADLLASGNDLYPTTRDHGTATLGVLIATHNNYGVSGLAPNVTIGLSPLVAGGPVSVHTLSALNTAASNAGYGDIVIFEQGQDAPDGTLWACTQFVGAKKGPMELDDALYSRIAQASREGVIVMEPAGNENTSLDQCFGGANEQKKFNRQAPNFYDSGAIIVGAGKYSDFFPGELGMPMGFSNYGNRVDLQGWGGEVATTGPINATAGAIRDPDYTGGYAGTSSATPIVAGATALVQSYFKNVKGRTLNGYEMRQLLVNTGTPGYINGHHIGPLPDVIRASQSNLISPIVTANGVRGSHGTSGAPDITVPSGTPVSINVSLDTGWFYGTPTDYWSAVGWNGTLWHWSGAALNWSQNQTPWFQTTLYGFSNFQWWNPTLYTGNYTFYFCVDTIQDGVYKNSDGLKTPALYCDSVTVKVN